MKERRPWRFWATFLLLAAGNLCIPVAESQSYGGGGARGDEGEAAALGFDGVLARHDGYVKGETPTIPQTSFSCSAQPHNPGLYADVETQCQVYHVCFEDRQESFLCGPGTNFNQRILACDFWYNFDCQASPSYFSVNQDIGKVPETVYRPDQPRTPQTQQPSYPSYPSQPQQPPSVGSYPPSVSVPAPPPRIQPQTPSIQTQPPRINIQQPSKPQIPSNQPPSIHPQPPRIQPQPPVFQPQPRPDPPRVAVKPNYPQQPGGHTSGGIRPPQQPLPPSIQQEDTGYPFDGYYPPKPASLPPPPPPRPQTPRPEFPPVISPPRISRPPLTPSIIRQPEGSISRPRVPVTVIRPEYHPDYNIKGNTDYRPPEQPRVPQPSRPVGTGYPSYPVSQRPVSPRPESQRPIERPVGRPAYQPPPSIQQEHVDNEYVPPPPPPPPRQPSRPSTSYVPPPPPRQPSRPSTPYVPPPPPPPIQQEVTNIGFQKPPKQPSRPVYDPPVPQKPVEIDYVKPQPPVAPSIIREQQKPVNRPPTRPQGSGSGQNPQRPKPVFPPASDHPNANIKGGPGYQQPPPQNPRFEPTRISRPSNPQTGYQVPPQVPRPRPDPSGGYDSTSSVKPANNRIPSGTGSGSYKPPQQGRIKKPSEPPSTVYQPPIQVVDHPYKEVKGGGYEPQQPQRIKSPSTSVSGVKRPQTGGGYQQPQTQRPRAPIVVSRPHPPPLPATNIKRTSPATSQTYEKPRPQPPSVPASSVKLPSQSQVQSVSNQPRFPSHQPIDHPNANVKGGSGYNQPQTRPVFIPQSGRPSGPPSSPSTSYEQKTKSTNQRQPTGSGYPSPPTQVYPPRGDDGPSQQQITHQHEFIPQRRRQQNIVPSSGVKTVSGIKSTTGYERQPSASHHAVLPKQTNQDYNSGSSYTRGPEIYPKPEFGQPSAPHQPISTPSRNSQPTKIGSPSQNSITQSQNKPAYQGSPVSSGSGTRGQDYPYGGVPGHQPPNQRQVFPYRENPDHPNESLKGSGAYRPPPPAGFQAAASEVEEQKTVPEPEPVASALLGDIGAE